MVNDDGLGNSFTPYYPYSILTERNERNLNRANKRANSTSPWIVKAVEGGSWKRAKDLEGASTFAIGITPLRLMRRLAGKDLAGERKLALANERKTASGEMLEEVDKNKQHGQANHTAKENKRLEQEKMEDFQNKKKLKVSERSTASKPY